MKKFLFLLLLSVLTIIAVKGAELKSPNGLVSVKITVSDRIYYSVFREGVALLEQCHLVGIGRLRKSIPGLRFFFCARSDTFVGRLSCSS